jgi:lysophospholipase L1-like esterase
MYAMEQRAARSENGTEPQFLQAPRLLVTAYLLHLVLPGLLLLDVVAAWWRGEIAVELWDAETAVAGLSALWLVTGVGALFLSRDRQHFVQRILKPLLSIYGIYLVLILVEVFIQATVRLTPPIPGLLSPGRRQVVSVDPGIFPGVHGTKTLTTNEWGLRGPMPPKQEPLYRILAIGGSTTICTALDDSEAWPQVLMEEMNAAQQSYPVWVGNAGVIGKNAVDHLVLLQWLPAVIHVDMVIFLIGVNDLQAGLISEGTSTQASMERAAGFRGDLPPGTRWRSWYPYYRRLQLFQLVRAAARTLQQRFAHSTSERPFDITAVRERRAASRITPLPDLHTGLEEYRGRLLSLASQCRDLDVRCLFLTQPSMWRSDLSPVEQGLLWLGYVGRGENLKAYVSPGDLARAMDAYNRTLLDVCEQNGLECYDLVSYVPKDTSAFYDDVHFNEAGAWVVAQTLKQYLLSKAPFAEQAKSSGASSP